MVTGAKTLLAIKALCLAPGLVESDRRVGVALIEHFNRRTGRCDPSIDRLAALLEHDRSTILRAIDRLVRKGLFGKARHGGHSNCNSYEPIWNEFDGLNAAWQDRFAGNARRQVASVPPQKAQPRDVPDGARATQTDFENLRERTSKDQRTSPSPSPRPTVDSRLAARQAAERRLHKGLLKTCSAATEYSEAIELEDRIYDRAVDEEVARPGTGAATLLRYLAEQQAAGSPNRPREAGPDIPLVSQSQTRPGDA